MLEALNKLENRFGKADTLLADDGYFSQNNVKACAEHGITPLIALGRNPSSAHSTAAATVTCRLANQMVAVHQYADHIAIVCDSAVAASHARLRPSQL